MLLTTSPLLLPTLPEASSDSLLRLALAIAYLTLVGLAAFVATHFLAALTRAAARHLVARLTRSIDALVSTDTAATAPRWAQAYCPRCFAHYQAMAPHLPLPSHGVPGVVCQEHRVSPALADLTVEEMEAVLEVAERARAERGAPDQSEQSERGERAASHCHIDDGDAPDALERAGWGRSFAQVRFDDDLRCLCN